MADPLQPPRQSYSVTVLGGSCEHRWPGTVHICGTKGTAQAPLFTLDADDSNCPECGLLAGTVMFGNGWDDGTAVIG